MHATERDPFPYTALTPTFKGIYRQPENEKLVCHSGGNIYIVELVASRLSVTCYPLEDICYVENGIILLHSWITICGVSKYGALTLSTLKFNAVTDHIMAPFVECMRPGTNGTQGVVMSADPNGLKYLANTNLKFMNYARACVRPGETIVQIVLQPEIRTELASLCGVTLSKPISPAHLIILTDCELISIRDDNSQSWWKGPPHGGIRTYMPRQKIGAASLASKGEDTLSLSIGLPGNLNIESLFESSQQNELELLLQRLN